MNEPPPSSATFDEEGLTGDDSWWWWSFTGESTWQSSAVSEMGCSFWVSSFVSFFSSFGDLDRRFLSCWCFRRRRRRFDVVVVVVVVAWSSIDTVGSSSSSSSSSDWSCWCSEGRGGKISKGSLILSIFWIFWEEHKNGEWCPVFSCLFAVSSTQVVLRVLIVASCGCYVVSTFQRVAWGHFVLVAVDEEQVGRWDCGASGGGTFFKIRAEKMKVKNFPIVVWLYFKKNENLQPPINFFAVVIEETIMDIYCCCCYCYAKGKKKEFLESCASIIGRLLNERKSIFPKVRQK